MLTRNAKHNMGYETSTDVLGTDIRIKTTQATQYA